MEKYDAFSRNHTMPYTAILIQEMFLAYKYGSIWWKTACLSENIGSTGTIAVAINNMDGLVINPDINLSDLMFKPLEEENKILFGLASIDGIGEEISRKIIENRPYKNIDDVIKKLLEPNNISLLNLFKLGKAGCFDRISDLDRRNTMIEIVRKTTPLKEKLTMSNLAKIIDKIPQELTFEKNIYLFKIEVLKKAKKGDGNYLLDMKYFEFISNLDVNYDIGNNEIIINIKEFDKYYKSINEKLREWLLSKETLNIYNSFLLNSTWANYFLGNDLSWEMETISFYSKGHELDAYNINDYYLISDFNKLSQEPLPDEANKSKYKIYKLFNIAGTVIDKNKGKKIIYILTKTGVVQVKLSDHDFAKFDKKIVRINGKEKEILDDSWFKKGTLVVITGYRRGNDFIGKVYKRNNQKTLAKIVGAKQGQVILQRDKIKE